MQTKPSCSSKTPVLQVWDSEKVIIIPDHYIFTADERANRNVDMMRWALSGIVQLAAVLEVAFQPGNRYTMTESLSQPNGGVSEGRAADKANRWQPKFALLPRTNISTARQATKQCSHVTASQGSVF